MSKLQVHYDINFIELEQCSKKLEKECEKEITLQKLDETLLIPDSIDQEETEILLIYHFQSIKENKLENYLFNLKRLGGFERINLSIIFNTEQELLENTHIFRLGACFAHSHEGDLTNSLLQLFYSVLDSPVILPKFASTKKFFFPIKANVLSFFDQIEEFNYQLASDVTISDEITLPYFDNCVTNFQLKRRSDQSAKSYTLFNYDLDPLHPSAWDESELSNWDTINTTIDNICKVKQLEITLIGEVKESTTNYLLRNQSEQCFYRKLSSLEATNFTSLKIQSDLILFSLKGDIEDNTDHLFELVDYIQDHDINPKPIILVSHSTSSSEALKKASGYDKILAYEDEFSAENLSSFIKILKKRNSSEKNVIPLNVNSSTTYIPKNIIITKMSESEVFFITEEEIPIGSVLRINIGIELILIVSAPSQHLDKVGDKTHYYSFIVGLKNERINLLRRLINKFVFIEVSKLDQISSFFTMQENSSEAKAVEESLNQENQKNQENEGESTKTASELSKVNKYLKGYKTKH